MSTQYNIVYFYRSIGRSTVRESNNSDSLPTYAELLYK
jgi:hypothetical protein